MLKSVFLKIKPYLFRLLAGILFCVFLVSTWFLFSTKPDYPEETHISLQKQLKQIIEEALQNKEENSHSLQFQKMETSSMKVKNRILAEFQYSFEDVKSTKITVSGTAQMKLNNPSSNTKHSIWIMDQFQTQPPVLEFSQPIVLLADKKLSDEKKEHSTKEKEELFTDDTAAQETED